MTYRDDNEFDSFLIMAVRQVQIAHDPHSFLEWFCSVVPQVAPSVLASIEGGASARRGALLLLARSIWSHTPIPDLRFHSRPPIPVPEPNSPCSCGSLRKYKQCCAMTENMPDPFEGLSFLQFVLDDVPTSRLAALPVEHADPEELAWVCREWLRNGEAERAALPLERVLSDAGHLDSRHIFAFDVLADCYTGRPRKKKLLIERMMNVPDPALRSAAFQRQVTILSDAGDFAAAWALFEQAQRLNPVDSALGLLEVTVLQAEGRIDQARERAQFWISRLARMAGDFSGPIDTLRRMIDSPETLHFESICADIPGLEDLRSLCAKLPAVVSHYRLDPMPEGFRLRLEAPLQNLLQEMYVAMEQAYSRQPGAADGVDFIRARPAVLQSFDALIELVMAIRSLPANRGIDHFVLHPLLDHSEALLRKVLQVAGVPLGPLPWAATENRPALQLLAFQALELGQRGESARRREVLELLVLSLNPEDNTGMRYELVRDYLKAGEALAALDLIERYPDPDAELRHNRALALLMLGRKSEALAALADACSLAPFVLPMLVAERPRQPANVRPDAVTPGGKDEAWHYRRKHRELWRDQTAIDWAAHALAQFKKRR